MKGSADDLLVKYLEQEGVEYLFGVPGGHLIPLYDSVVRSGKIKPVLTKHEAGAAFMAYGYAVTSGKVGVCCGTVGPGATNLITGVSAAYMDSVPIVALTAQVGTTAFGKGALQEGTGVGRTINQVALFDKITKLSTMEVRSRNLPETMQRALRIAQTGRPGPVHVDLPADVQGDTIEHEILPVEGYRLTKHSAIDPAQVKEVADLLLHARKPAILVGYGAYKARDGALQRLAEQLQVPVASTLRAKGLFPEDHSLALGCVGLYGTKAANSYLRSGLDVLLVVGASFHEFTSHCWDPAFKPSEALVHVDIDPNEIGKNYPPTLGVVADALVFLDSLVSQIGDAQRQGNDIMAFKKENAYFEEDAMNSDVVPVKPQRLMKELTEVLPRDTIILADIGNTVTWAERYLQAYPEGRFIALSGLAAMGSATAACVGAKLGHPQSPVVCLCGDGDFQMTGMEVATAANYQIPVIWVILRNDRLAMVHDIETLSYQGRHSASLIRDVDYVALAKSLGAEARRTDGPSDIRQALSEALKSDGPVVIEVPIDKDEMPPVKPRMLALRRSLGLPDTMSSFSWDALRALWSMRKER